VQRAWKWLKPSWCRTASSSPCACRATSLNAPRPLVRGHPQRWAWGPAAARQRRRRTARPTHTRLCTSMLTVGAPWAASAVEASAGSVPLDRPSAAVAYVCRRLSFDAVCPSETHARRCEQRSSVQRHAHAWPRPTRSRAEHPAECMHTPGRVRPDQEQIKSRSRAEHPAEGWRWASAACSSAVEV